MQNFTGFLQNFAKCVSSFCRSRKMLKNAYLVAKIGFDTAENRSLKVMVSWYQITNTCYQKLSNRLPGWSHPCLKNK